MGADLPDSNAEDIKKAIESLTYQTGTIIIKDPSTSKDLATISTGNSLQYLNPRDTKTVLETLWGKPSEGSFTWNDRIAGLSTGRNGRPPLRH